MTTATCHTEGCGNEGIGLDVTTEWTDDDGATQTVSLVVCGVCGQEITDLGTGAQSAQDTNEGTNA